MPDLQLEVVPDLTELARRAAAFVAERAREAARGHGRFTFAVSGGSTPWAMFAELRNEDVPWAAVDLFQVDERVAPHDDPDRNLTHLEASLPRDRADRPRVHAMPVEDVDLEAAAASYSAELPDRFDLVHLGLGPDGHTASLVPDDPVLDVTDRAVALTLEYNRHRRMTLTYPALARADRVMWLIAGTDKVDALEKLLARDASIPGARVSATEQIVFADRAAAAV
jgi:6-phosphogluconolactonase